MQYGGDHCALVAGKEQPGKVSPPVFNLLDLGRWQRRNMETVQIRITELDKLLFDSWALVDGDATFRVTSFKKLSLLQIAKLRKVSTMKGRRLVRLTLRGESSAIF